MLSFFVKIMRFFLVAIMSMSVIFSPLTGDKQGVIEDKNENCLASFAAIADTHLTESSSRVGMLQLGLIDMQEAASRLDALVINGDITELGYYKHWDNLVLAFDGYDPADKIILTAGNHDTWGPNRDDFENPVDGVKPTFIKYVKDVTGMEITEMYYSTTIGEYPAIILGSEDDGVDAYISDTQLNWFSAEMEELYVEGKPIFIFLHQPINETHGLPYIWGFNKEDPIETGGIGEQSDAVLEIIKNYNNVFYFSGHLHAGFSVDAEKERAKYTSVEYLENNAGNKITLVNIPCYQYIGAGRGVSTNTCGFVVEVYENEVLLRARHFSSGTWCTKYDTTVELDIA